MARDWLKSLFRASFKGVPFWVDRDSEEGGRRVVVHQFPMRDDPFLEDLGEEKRSFDVMAYVASDNADSEAAAVSSACTSRGPGVLVLPAHGPLMVRCVRFDRRRDMDRHGKVALSLKFVREGASSSLVTVRSLANLAFVAADNLALSVAAEFLAGIVMTRQPDYVAEAALEPILDALAMIETVRTTEPVETEASAIQRNEIQALFTVAPDLVRSAPATLAERTVAAARALSDAIPAETASRAFEALWQESPTPVVPVNPTTRGSLLVARNQVAGYLVLRMAALAAYCEAIVRTPLTDRPAALTLRANVAEYFEAELESLTVDQSSIYNAMVKMRDATISYLSHAILDLAPVVTVSSNYSMPSLYWGWRMYQDPSRSTEVVTRNRVVHPSFMPTEFEALSR